MSINLQQLQVARLTLTDQDGTDQSFVGRVLDMSYSSGGYDPELSLTLSVPQWSLEDSVLKDIPEKDASPKDDISPKDDTPVKDRPGTFSYTRVTRVSVPSLTPENIALEASQAGCEPSAPFEIGQSANGFMLVFREAFSLEDNNG